MSVLIAAPALAQDEGVFIDPDSPSGKEYEIPLEAERRQADPAQERGAPVQHGARSSPLFGTGIVSEPGAGMSRSARADRDGNAADPDGKAGDPGADAPVPDGTSEPQESGDEDDEVVRAAASNPGAPGGGASVPLTIGGVALAVLLVGGLAGLLLRRRA